jgi:methylenetetrahydrofolate--tRNA-(uracil-5-)-methyltransferase
MNLARLLRGDAPLVPPPTTMLGALYRYLREAAPQHFQPMNANFGLLDPLDPPVKDKARKRERFAERALAEMERFVNAEGGMRKAASNAGADVPHSTFRIPH